MEPRRLTGLRPQVYEHPSDSAALDALQNTAGLETVVRKLNEWGFERLIRVQLTGSYLRVTPDNFPDLHTLLVRSCEVIDLPRIPDLYLAPGDGINALTAGVEKPLVVLHTGAVELLSPDELAFVLSHELGHIKSGHVLYYQIAEFLPVVVGILGAATFGLGEVLSVGMQAALLRWRRMAEFTADRAGLLGIQDASVGITTLAKLAGLPPKYYAAFNTEDFIAQAREFEAMDADKLNLVAKWLSTMGTTHPWTVLRANQLLRWVDDGGFQHTLEKPREALHKLPEGVRGFCTQCGYAHRGDETFCPGCGRPLTGPVQTSIPAPPPAPLPLPVPPPPIGIPPVAVPPPPSLPPPLQHGPRNPG